MKTLTYTTITTHLSKDLDRWLGETAKREQVTRRELVEKALRAFRLARERERYAASFRKMSKDKEYMKEMRDLAEMGMGDFWEQLKRYEE